MRNSIALTALITATGLGIGITPAMAQQHELEGYVSASGIEFVEAQIPSYIPTHLEPPPFTKKFACMEATQKNTVIDLSIDALDLVIPQDGTFRLDITLSANGGGDLDIDGPYVCLGSASCTDTFDIRNARAIIDFAISIENGAPMVSVTSLDLQLDADDIDIALDNCAIDGVVNFVIGFAKDYLLDYMLEKVESMAVETLSPMLGQMVGGFTSFGGTLGSTDFEASLRNLTLKTNGITIGAGVDLTTKFPPAACIAEYDKGDPSDHAGSMPNLAAGKDTHLALAVNYGLLDDALYQMWRRGLMCITHETLEGLGVHLDFDHITQLLPGFPPGTIMRLEVNFKNPPRVTSAAGEGAAIGIVIEGANIKMIGTLPDGSSRVLEMEMDMEASAAIAINPATNALEVALTGAHMTRLDMLQDAAEMGFDVARLLQVIHESVLPSVAGELGTMPITGPVFSFADYAIILRELDSNEAYLSAKVDMFRMPANDTNAPDTQILQSPAGAVSPHNAKLLVTGNDSEIPVELLQYVVTIDGVPALKPTYVREIKVGEVGVTKTYAVTVAAMDLAGNTDPTPATADVLVDGISPSIVIIGPRIRNMPDTNSVEISWQATDDLTDSSKLRAQLRIHRLKDPANAIDTEEVAVIDIAPGQTTASFEVNSGNTYRAELHVIDEAGNDSSSSVLLKVGGSGCNVAGGGASGSLPIVFAIFMALAVLRRRS